MRKKRLVTTILILTLFTSTILSFADNESQPTISAEAGILMDASTGQVLYQKNMDKKEFPASITKIMTILLGVESEKLKEKITMSRNAVFSIPRNSAHIALDEGEEIKLEDALYGAMLPSANEACNGIAEHLSGSISEFAKVMTQRAIASGAKNTNFANPNGLHDPNHYTTAYDMAMITREALQNEEFRKIFGTTSYQIPPTNKQSEIRYLWTTHKMLKETDFFYDKAIGGKTGYTSEALNTLVTVANDGNRELIVVLLRNQSGRNNYIDTKKLFEYGFSSFNQINLSHASIQNPYAEKDAEQLEVALIDELKKSKWLIPKQLSETDVFVKFNSVSESENGKNFIFSIDLNSPAENMPSHLGELTFDVAKKTLIEEQSIYKFKNFLILSLKFIGKMAIVLIIMLVIIYFYVNRNYYKKRILKKYRKNGRTRKKKKSIS